MTSPVPPPPPPPLSDDQRKHLDFIQAVIARLASSSAALKGWTLTIAVAAFGFSATTAVPVVAILGMLVIAGFAVLDAYYLHEEQKFRKLFDEASQGAVNVYSMNKDAYSASCPWGKTYQSWSILGFYGPIIVIGVAALVWTLLHVTC